MNKETKKKLLKPFPKEVVMDPPKGKFGKYVNHAVYVERLRDCDVKYDWKFEPIIINDKVIGGKGTITIEGMGSYDGAGDVESAALNRATLGECLKLAESDAFKRACMRFGLGVELWSGTDDFYADDNKQEPIEKKGRVKDVVIEQEDKALVEAKKEFVKEVEDNPNNKQQLDHTVAAMIPDEKVRKKMMNDTYKDVTETQGFPTNISEWNSEQMSTYITMIEVVSEDTSDIEKVLGEFKDITQNCPECGKSEWIEDNRKKKQDDPDKFGKIPSWSCNNYGDKEGCGWTGWGDTDCPTEWL